MKLAMTPARAIQSDMVTYALFVRAAAFSGSLRFAEPGDVLHRPQSLFNPRRYRRRHVERLVDPDEIVPNCIERDHVRVIFELLAEGIRKHSETAHRHPHRWVRPLDVTRADVLRVGVTGNLVPPRADAFGRAIATGGFLSDCRGAIELDQDAVIDISAERLSDGPEIRAMLIRG
jgi:hypothetical protein